MTCDTRHLLLLLFLSLNLCKALDDTCVTRSDSVCQREDDLTQLCKNKSETNSTIFSCNSEESKSEDGSKEFKVGENITLVAQGDHLGYGCSFEIKNTDSGVTCCYIRASRENQRRGEEDPELCNERKQPAECRQPGGGKYEVKEILRGRWCRLTLFEARTTDSGDYHVKFPKEPTSNKKITVTVESDSLSTAAAVGIGLAVPIGAVILWLLLYRFMLKPWLEKRELKEREEDEAIFEEIKKENKEEYEKRLGRRSILGLRDKSYNNIYHLASFPDWTDRMTEIVLGVERGGAGEADPDLSSSHKPTIFSLTERRTPFSRSPIASCYSSVFPYYLWPSSFPYPTALDSENKSGDTPLMIAARYGQKDLIQQMLDNGADVNKKNKKGQTALYKTVEFYPVIPRMSALSDEERKAWRQRKEEAIERREQIVKLLLKKGATVYAGQGLLHTAIRKNSLDLMKLLLASKEDITDIKDHSSIKIDKSGTERLTLTRNTSFLVVEDKLQALDDDKTAETAFQLAVKLGYEDIVDFLIRPALSAKKPWNRNLDEIVKTVYPAVKGGHIKILSTLIEEGNLTCNDSRVKLLEEAVNDNNPSAVGVIFSKYYNSTTVPRTPRTPRTKKNTAPVPDQPQLTEIEQVLDKAKRQRDALDREKKSAEYLVCRLSKGTENCESQFRESETDRVKEEALTLARAMKEDFMEKSQYKNAAAAQHMIDELEHQAVENQGSSDHLLDARPPNKERKGALRLAKEKKNEYENNFESAEKIVKKLLEEEGTARALSIVKEKEKNNEFSKIHRDAGQFIIEELSKEYKAAAQEHRSEPRRVPDIKLLEKMQTEFEKQEETKNAEAMEQAVKILKHNLETLQERALVEEQKEKERCAPDEIGAAQNSFDPLSKKRNKGELEQSTREEKREKQKQDSKSEVATYVFVLYFCCLIAISKR